MKLDTEAAVQARLDSILSGAEAMELRLCDEIGTPIGVMRPVTAWHLDQTNIMERLTEWRNANMNKFLTQFEGSPERTKAWVQNVLLKSRGQMLFLVYDQNDLLVGHFGFKNLTSQSVLLDNAIRGERGGHPKLFVFAGKALVQWLWRETSVQQIDGYVMADNASSIMMNRQIGFTGWTRLPLLKRIIGGDTHWYMGKEGQASPEGRFCYSISIYRSLNPFKPANKSRSL